MIKRKFFAVVLVLSLTLSLVGCSRRGKEEKKDNESSLDKNVEAELTVWGPQEDQAKDDKGNEAWLTTMCNEFNKEYPNVKFKFGVCPEGEAKDKVTTDPKAAADVFMCANDNITELISANAISKIGGDAEKYVKESNDEIVAESVVVDGATYGIPFSTNTWFMIYDKTAFTEEEAGNFNKMLEKNKVAFPLSNTWYVAAFYYANGCKIFDDGKKKEAGFDFEGDKAGKVTEYLTEVANNPNFMNDDKEEGISALREGKVKAMFAGSWHCQAAKEALGDKFAVKQLPTVTIDGQEKQMKSFAGSKVLAVNSNTKNPELANKFAQFLASKEAQQKHYDIRGIIPSNKEVLVGIQNDEVVKAQNDTMNNTSVAQPFIKEMGNYWEPMEALAKGIVNKEITKDNAKDKTKELNTALNKDIK